MSSTMKLDFNTEDSIHKMSIVDPKEGVTQDEAKDAMEAVVASGAFEDIVSPNKATLVTTDSDVIYEA